MKTYMLFNKLAIIILVIAFSVTKNEISYAQYEEETTTNGQNQDESVDHSSPQPTATPSVQSEVSIRPEDAPATSQIILPREDARDGHYYSPFYRGYNLDHALAQLRGEMPWKSSEWSSGVTRQIMLDSRKMQIQRYVDAGLINLPGGGTTVTDEHVQYALKNGKMYQPIGQFGNTGWDEKTGRFIPYFESLNGSTTIFGFSFPGGKYNFALLKMGTGTTEGRVKNPCVNPGEMITPNPEYAPPITKVETVTETEIYERVDTAFVHTTDTLIQTVETERVEFVEIQSQSSSGMVASGGIGFGMSTGAGFMVPQPGGYYDYSYHDNSYYSYTGDTYIIEDDPDPVPPPVEVPPTGNPTLPPNWPPSDENPQPPTDGNPPEPTDPGYNPWNDGTPISDPIDGTGGGPSLGSGKGIVKGDHSSPVVEGNFFSAGATTNASTVTSIPKPANPKGNTGQVKDNSTNVNPDPRPMNPKGSIPSAPVKGNTPKSENTFAFGGPSKGNTPTSSTYSEPKPIKPATGPAKGNVPKSNTTSTPKPVSPQVQPSGQVKGNTPKSNTSNLDPRPMNPATASNQSTHSKPNTGGWGYSDFSGGTKGPSRGNTSGVTPKGNNNQSTPRPSSIATPKDNPATTTDNARVAGGTKSVKQSARPDRGNNPQVKTPAKKNSPQIKSKPRQQQPKVSKSAPKSKPQARPQGGSKQRSSRQR